MRKLGLVSTALSCTHIVGLHDGGILAQACLLVPLIYLGSKPKLSHASLWGICGLEISAYMGKANILGNKYTDV